VRREAPDVMIAARSRDGRIALWGRTKGYARLGEEISLRRCIREGSKDVAASGRGFGVADVFGCRIIILRAMKLRVSPLEHLASQ